MAVLKIITYPDKRLREVARPLDMDADFSEFSSSGARKAVEDLRDTLVAHPSGFALAATQVGIPFRMVAFREPIPGNVTRKTDVFMNPRIVSLYGEPEWTDEGCLSFPHFRKLTKRHQKALVSFDVLNEDTWHTVDVEVEGIWAQAFQHEVAHLDGVLFVDDLPKREREKIAMQVTRTKR